MAAKTPLPETPASFGFLDTTSFQESRERETVHGTSEATLAVKEGTKHHGVAFARTHDIAVTNVGEAAKLMCAASEAVAELTQCTLNKLTRAEHCPMTRMQRMAREVLADELRHDMHTLTYAVATSRNISAGVETIVEYSAAVHRAAVASYLPGPFITANGTVAAMADKFCCGYSHHVSPLKRACRSDRIPKDFERNGESIHELAETLRIGKSIMYFFADTHYLAEEMRIMGLLSDSLSKRLISFTRDCVAAIRHLHSDNSSTYTIARNSCCQASGLTARSVPALEIEAHATKAFWVAVHKHFRNVEGANATRPKYKWLGRIWERTMRTSRYKAMVRAQDLLDQARAARVLAQETLETLANEVHELTGEPRWTLSEVFSVF
ncbi:hypothetical protein SEPCBS57363_005995 [Sporothrix epigloea]|uniref:Uncharacterized protein n=1 Tax=Sporothrix epigloea TaxID=1892477 RepID=A0ABP0E0M8_9PEZI